MMPEIFERCVSPNASASSGMPTMSSAPVPMPAPDLLIGAYVDRGFAWKRAEDKTRLREALLRAELPEHWP